MLLLADSDDAGLEVDCKALLVASDDATAGNFFYEDADRGGTDTPLDGELGLGDDDTVISGIRRRTATLLQLNDDNNPVALDIGAYFSAGGAGADLTIYLQTLAGEVSFPAAASFSRVDQVRFTLPADAQTLLDGLEDGDRWIFKAARPEPVAADHAVDADPASWAFATPQPQVTHTADATLDHAVNANAAAWAFALPEPGVTKTGSPTDHAVDAGAAGWTFALPEPEVTRTGPAAADHAVDAGAASWAFALPAPSITSTGVAAALDVLVRGVRQDGVQQPSIRVRHAIAKTSTASFTLRGRLDAIPIPAYGDSVEIRDVSGETVFSGFVRTPDPAVSDFGAFLDSATVRCQGHNDALRYRRIHGTEGVEIVEAANGAAQFSADRGASRRVYGRDRPGRQRRGDPDRHSLPDGGGGVARAGRRERRHPARNDGSPGPAVPAGQPDRVRARPVGPGGPVSVFSLLRDPRKVRSRQILRYGEAVAQRTINGDGSTRAFLVAGTQAAVDYMAAGVAARALNAQAGDQGLRMRADADSRARSGGGIDFFGGNAGGPGVRALRGCGRWPGPPGSRSGCSQTGTCNSAPGSTWTRRHATGSRCGTTVAGTPCGLRTGSRRPSRRRGAPWRDSDSDFEISRPRDEGRRIGRVHGDTVFHSLNRSANSVGRQRGFGFRIGQATVRDSRFDSGCRIGLLLRKCLAASMVVFGDRLLYTRGLKTAAYMTA